MNKIITLTLTFILLLSGSITANKPPKWYYTAGLNMSKFMVGTQQSNRKIGLQLGLKAEWDLPMITKGVFLDASALLLQKGGQVTAYEHKAKLNSIYVEIPLNIGYKFDVNEKLSVFGGLGPYLAYGIYGKAVWDGGDEIDYVFKIDEDQYDDMNYSRFDAGLGFRTGVELNKKIQVFFGWGFSFGEFVMQNDNINISCAIKF